MVCMHAQLLSCVQLFATPWTIALQFPLSMGILLAGIQELVTIFYSTDLSGPWLDPESPPLAGSFFTTEPPGKTQCNGM